MRDSYNAKIVTIKPWNNRTIRLIWFAASVFSLCLFVITDLCAGQERKEDKSVQLRVESAFGKNCEKLLAGEIKLAKKEVLVAIYSITKWSIRDALVEAAERGAAVKVKYDAGSADYKGMGDAISHMKKRGVECIAVEMKNEDAKMHHKFTVIDRKEVLTGSYNYTVPASSGENYENLVLIESDEIAKKFADEFERIKSK